MLPKGHLDPFLVRYFVKICPIVVLDLSSDFKDSGLNRLLHFSVQLAIKMYQINIPLNTVSLYTINRFAGEKKHNILSM